MIDSLWIVLWRNCYITVRNYPYFAWDTILIYFILLLLASHKLKLGKYIFTLELYLPILIVIEFEVSTID